MEIINVLTLTGFPVLTLFFFGRLYQELKSAIQKTDWSTTKKQKIANRFLVALLLWAALVSMASLSGYTSNFSLFPLNVMPMLFLPLLTTIVLLFTADVKTLARHLNLRVLTLLQSFRIFVELLLWMLFLQNLLPEQMTFEGRKFDILAGITALLAARLLLPHKRAMIAWNIFGLVLLINIVAIALLSMPTPFRVFHNEPANTIVTHFPYVLLPTFLVPLAYVLHFISLKKLLIKS